MNPVQSRAQGDRSFLMRQIKQIVNKLDGPPFLIDVLINKSFYTDTLIDTGCLCYSAFNRAFVKRHKLPQIPIKPKELKLAKEDPQQRVIHEITYADIDIDGKLETIWGYVINDLAFNLILGDPWMRKNDVVYNARRRFIRFGLPGGLTVKAKGWENNGSIRDISKLSCLGINKGSTHQILGSEFAALVTEARKTQHAGMRIFAASIAEITKALEVKKK